MRTVMEPVEERGGEPSETSGGEDTAPATITRTRYGLSATLQDFEQTILPHMDAAYNLARWLTSNSHFGSQEVLSLGPSVGASLDSSFSP